MPSDAQLEENIMDFVQIAMVVIIQLGVVVATGTLAILCHAAVKQDERVAEQWAKITF